jgi:hypothetical protein
MITGSIRGYGLLAKRRGCSVDLCQTTTYGHETLLSDQRAFPLLRSALPRSRPEVCTSLGVR